jgi:DNA polymerase I-like protein with 3'-5' exonuclease and polymerase domains
MRELVRPVAVDAETTGLRPFQGDKATVLSFADETGAWSLPADEGGQLLRRLVDDGRTIVLHNGIFDRAVFSASFGIEFPDAQHVDTMALSWLLDENAQHGLKAIGSRLFGVDAKAEQQALQALMRGRTVDEVYKEFRAELPKRGEPGYESAAETRARAKVAADATTKTWADLTFEDLEPYATQDAALTWKVLHHQLHALQEDTFVTPYVDRAHDVAGLSYRINRTGICVNAEHAETELARVSTRIDALAASYGDVNLNAPQQVAEMIYDRWGLPCPKQTATGNRSTDKEALEALTYDPRVAGLVEYRSLAKQRDAYYLPLLDRTGADGRIHPSLHPFRTVTGRWSCSGPNLQTIPREATAAEIRKVFCAGPGLVLGEWDLSQIEVRVAADMAKEGALLEVYARDGDVYQALADEIGVERFVAKTVILSAQYGVGPKKLAATLAKGTGKAPDVKRAKQILAAYWATYPQLEKLMNGLQQVGQRRGYIPLWKPGRRRLLRSPHNPYPRWYTALNAAIQGGAAEFMKDVLIELEAVLKYDGNGRIVLTVHDSVIIEHEPGAEAGITEALADITSQVSPYSIATPWEHKAWDGYETGVLAA